MTIRLATTDDVPSLIGLGKRVQPQTRFAGVPVSDERVTRSLKTLINDRSGRYVFLVADSADGSLAGSLIGVLERHIFNDRPTASVMYFIVLPEQRMGGHAVRLLRAFERWAKNRGVAEIVFGINSGGDFERVGRFAKRMGYRQIGGIYALAS